MLVLVLSLIKRIIYMKGKKIIKIRKEVPKFVSIVLIILGCVDLVRGFIHTVLLEYAAINIAGLDLTTAASDQLRLLGTFGISNWITGVAFIIIGLKAKQISLYIIGLIPIAYGLSTIAIKINTADYAASQANWGGSVPMLIYMGICIITFIIAVIKMYSTKDVVKNT